MPDRHNGDRGIEAFTRDGCVFQCYAAEEPKTTKELYEDQRDKLTSDLRKLNKNSQSFKKIFGQMKVHRYIFMVHRLESTLLVEHAGSKAAEVRNWNLEFIASSFEVQVVTDDAYSSARSKLRAVPETILSVEAATNEDIERWERGNSQFMATADRKLTDLGSPERVSQDTRGSYFKHFSMGRMPLSVFA